MSMRNILLSYATCVAVITFPAFAGPYRDAELAIVDAYASYRTALFQTNQKNRTQTEAALDTFRSKWNSLSLAWKSAPPPQYADDPKFGQTVDTVAKLAEEAMENAKAGDLAKSHETLEGIRDALAQMRARNGVIAFSDRMNAYHTQMEHILERKYSTPGELSEDAAVLAFLVSDIAKHRPEGVDISAFDQAVNAVDASVKALRNATRSGEQIAIEMALKSLKAPYSRMFLRFG